MKTAFQFSIRTLPAKEGERKKNKAFKIQGKTIPKLGFYTQTFN